MNPEKRITDPKLNHLKLYRLVELVREIYPNQRTENPYHNQIQSHIHRMDVEEQILLHNLIHSLTLLNAHNRKKEKTLLYSTETDNLNALELLKNPDEKLSFQALELYNDLEKTFGYEPFTKEEALKQLSINNKVFIYRAKILKAHYMLNYIGLVQKPFGRTSLYQLINNQLHLEAQSHQEEDAWQEAMLEHEEFKGFTELQYRTDYSPSKE